MRPIRLIPADTRFDFVGKRRFAFAFSILLLLLAVASVAVQGLNFGIDFRGGTLIEVRTNEPADIAGMRTALSGAGLGEVALQEFGAPTDVLIRIQQQPGGSEAQATVVETVRGILGEGVTIRRVEFVGPKVGGELIEAGILAVVLALGAILIYISLRFEWQFGVAAVLALAHDVFISIGLFSVTQMEFNLSTVAAVLTIAGYSINDTVVVFDRTREALRKYKSLPMRDVLNMAVNETLSRTLVTSGTTLLALLALVGFGGEVIRSFCIALIWGVVIGTYSSIFIAVPILLYLNLRRSGKAPAKGEARA